MSTYCLKKKLFALLAADVGLGEFCTEKTDIVYVAFTRLYNDGEASAELFIKGHYTLCIFNWPDIAFLSQYGGL